MLPLLATFVLCPRPKSVSIDRFHSGQRVNNNSDKRAGKTRTMIAGNSTESADRSADDRTAATTSWSYQSSQQIDWAMQASMVSSPIVQSNRFAALDHDASSDDQSDNIFFEQCPRRSAKRRRRQLSMLNQQVQQEQPQHQQSRSQPVTAAQQQHPAGSSSDAVSRRGRLMITGKLTVSVGHLICFSQTNCEESCILYRQSQYFSNRR